MIANFGGYYIHPSKWVKFRVLVLTARPVFLPFGSRFSIMVLRFLLISALCAPGAVHAQIAALAPPPKPEEAYLPLKKCWDHTVENIGASTVSVNRRSVYVAEAEGRVRALSARTGVVDWVTELGGRVASLHAVPESGIAALTTVAVGSKRSLLRVLNQDSGLVRYSVAIDAGADSFLVSSGSRLLVVDPDGTVLAFNLQDGSAAWQLELPAKLSTAPASLNGHAIVATADKKLAVISIATGTQIASISTERVTSTLAIRENGMILAGDERGRVTNYRDNGGSVWWRFKSGARIGSILETSEGILIGSYDNFLYLVSKYTGDVKWKRRLDGRILSRPAVVAKKIVAASSTEESAQVVEMQTGKPVDRIAFGEGRFMLAQPYVADGNISIFTVVDGVMAFAPNGCS